MHKHRKKIGRKRSLGSLAKITKRFVERRQVCSICQAESLVVDKNGNKICRNCEKTSKIHQKLQTKQEGTKCPSCNSTNYEKKGFRKEKQRYICKNCDRNWTSNGVAKNLFSGEIKTRDTFQRENTVEEIVTYLKNQETNNMPIKFWYRNDTKAREVHDYFVDDRYLQVRSEKGYYIKFLIDKIRKI